MHPQPLQPSLIVVPGPGCESFITSDLLPTFELEGFSAIMNVTFVPYGNAKIDLNAKTVTCQHGEVECDGNTWEQCAIYKNPSNSDHLPFVGCLASKSSAELGTEKAYEDCASAAGLDFNALKACHGDAGLAWDLQVAASVATPADHQYTPWVVIDGVLFETRDFKKAVCDAYNGDDKPEGCGKRYEEVEDLRSSNKW